MIAQASSLLGPEQRNEQQAKASWLAKYAEQSYEWLDFTCPVKYPIQAGHSAHACKSSLSDHFLITDCYYV